MGIPIAIDQKPLQTPLQVIIKGGGVGERLKPAVLKTVRPERVSGVQIPPPPPLNQRLALVERIAFSDPASDCAARYHSLITTSYWTYLTRSSSLHIDPSKIAFPRICCCIAQLSGLKPINVAGKRMGLQSK